MPVSFVRTADVWRLALALGLARRTARAVKALVLQGQSEREQCEPVEGEGGQQQHDVENVVGGRNRVQSVAHAAAGRTGWT